METTLLIPFVPFPASWYETNCEYELRQNEIGKMLHKARTYPWEYQYISSFEISVTFRPPAMASWDEFVGKAGI